MKSLEGARSGLARRQLGVPHGPLRGESDRRNHIRWSAAKINELVQIVQAVQSLRFVQVVIGSGMI
jgi:hypothetical protein